MNTFSPADNGIEWVFLEPDECHNGNLEQFEKFKVNVYTRVKFEFCIIKNMYLYSSSRLTWIQKVFTLPFILFLERVFARQII